jgi:hypothetical protein
MKNFPDYNDFLNETLVFDEVSKIQIFNSDELLSPNEFFAKVKKSIEASRAVNGSSNFGKGIQAVKFLKDNLPVPLEIQVYRSKWNYGGNLCLNIGVKGMGKSPFYYHSGNSTETQSYSFGKYFDGLVVDGFKEPIQSMVRYGSYKSISHHDEMLQDIVNVFKAYESKFGKPFSVATAMKLEKESEKIKTVFKSTESKINPLYNELSSVANKLGISVGYPFLSEKNREIRFKINEPRMYRHPDEYGERAEKALSSKEYTNFEKLVNKIHDILEKTGKQIGYSVDVSARWN